MRILQNFLMLVDILYLKKDIRGLLEPDERILLFYYDIDKVFEKSRVYRVDF